MYYGIVLLCILEVAIELQEKGNGEELPRFFSIAWSLWIRRNNMVYKEGLQENVTEVFEMGVSVANSYHSLLTECATKPKVLKWILLQLISSSLMSMEP